MVSKLAQSIVYGWFSNCTILWFIVPVIPDLSIGMTMNALAINIFTYVQNHKEGNLHWLKHVIKQLQNLFINAGKFYPEYPGGLDFKWGLSALAHLSMCSTAKNKIRNHSGPQTANWEPVVLHASQKPSQIAQKKSKGENMAM